MKRKRIFSIVSTILVGTGIALYATIPAAATTVSDVIAHAYAVGLPEDTIQACINQFSGGTYTSSQCDKAIAALDEWAAERQNAIDRQMSIWDDDEEEDDDTAQAAEDAATNGGETESSADNDTDDTATDDVDNTVTDAEFTKMSMDEKEAYLESLDKEERAEFLENMSNDAKNSMLRDMDTSAQLEVMASLLDVGDVFGIYYSIDSVSDDAIVLSARDADGNLLSVTTYGETVEKTGKSYTVPILIGGGAIVFACVGLGVAFAASSRKKREDRL